MPESTPPAPIDLPDDLAAQAWVTERTDAALGRARDLAEGLKTAPPTTALAVLQVWDEVERELHTLAGTASLLANVHPIEAVRSSCEQTEIAVDELSTALSQDADLYAVFERLPRREVEQLDPLARRIWDKTLLEFRRSGVDRDRSTRSRIAEINQRLTTLDLEFSRIARDDVRTVSVTADRLTGLPADWIEEHRPDDAGRIVITTDYPDLLPVRMFATDPALRRELVEASLQRGWPEAEPVLAEMLRLRHELATLLDYPDWPSYDAEVKMIAEGEAIPAFIDKIAEAASEPMRRDLATLLERKRADEPDAVDLSAADSAYYEELVRKEQYDVDSQLVRTYFDFPRVRDGLLAVTGRLFGLRYEAVTDAHSWHEDVTVHDVYPAEGEGRLGRIHLDLHPREGKYKHAAQFDLAPGLAGRQLAEGALVCNLPRGLMEHDDVVTLFHEFGHLLHHVLAGQGEWTRFSGVATEWDFVEAPSQMLEEWAWDVEVLRTFATNASGEPIPADLVARMRAADDFGKGFHARQQMFYAAVSYWFHADRAAPDGPRDLTERMTELQRQYSPQSYLPGTHFFASFGHLGGYSSAYYTYMWSLVIAKDLFSAFDPGDLYAPAVAARYRDTVLAPGGSRDAADMVEEFLGRPVSFGAYASWLAAEPG